MLSLATRFCWGRAKARVFFSEPTEAFYLLLESESMEERNEFRNEYRLAAMMQINAPGIIVRLSKTALARAAIGCKNLRKRRKGRFGRIVLLCKRSGAKNEKATQRNIRPEKGSTSPANVPFAKAWLLLPDYGRKPAQKG
ncbi:MAG: hypothetical protein ACLU99_14915 [Alphaproteobacteria bacterium]